MTDLFENLGAKPVDKRNNVGNNHDPGDDRKRFAKALSERSPHLFSLIYLRKKNNHHKNYQEKQPFTHQAPVISNIS